MEPVGVVNWRTLNFVSVVWMIAMASAMRILCLLAVFCHEGFI